MQPRNKPKSSRTTPSSLGKRRANLESSASQKSATSAAPPRVLRSAYRPSASASRSRFSRTPSVITYNYRHLCHKQAYEFAPSTFLLSSAADVMQIQIASDWVEGRSLMTKSQRYDHTGFIGDGHTKHGIYVRRSRLHCSDVADDYDLCRPASETRNTRSRVCSLVQVQRTRPAKRWRRSFPSSYRERHSRMPLMCTLQRIM